MAEVKVSVGGRSYPVFCDDGQEARVRELASRIDAEARSFAAAGPSVTEAKLLLMSALMIADKLDEAEARLRDQPPARPAPPPAPVAPPSDDLFAEAAIEAETARIEEATKRIEALTIAAEDAEPDDDDGEGADEEGEDPLEDDSRAAVIERRARRRARLRAMQERE